MTLAIVAIGLSGILVGAIGGAVTTIRLWLRYIDKPENAKKMLQGAYTRSHQHWLQRSKEDETKVCPVCGWSPERRAEAIVEFDRLQSEE